MIEHLWFQNSIEGLFLRSLKGAMSPDLRTELKSVGLDLSHLVPAYPVGTLRMALERVAPLVLPGATWEEQQHELGRRLVRGYFDTMTGRALSGLLRLVGPQRGITRLQRSFRSVTNYLNVQGEILKLGEARVLIEPVDGLAHFLVGILEESGGLLLQNGASKVTLWSNEGERCEVRIEWGDRLN